MKTPLCELLGIEFPLFAFSHCRDVVAAVSNAGGFGVLGASRHTPEELELELKWIDEHVHGRPYGVDLLIPENMVGRDENVDAAALRARVPARHKEFVLSLLAPLRRAIDLDDPIVAKRELSLLPAVSARLMDVAFSHPIKLIANALGVPPQSMIDRGRAQGVAVAALVGAKEHAIRQVQAGVDIIVAEGAEAGGHCGEVSTLVLVPEVMRAIQPIRPVPVLAAGGIVTGRQMAAMMALGAAGAWTGSVWLMTQRVGSLAADPGKVRGRDVARHRAIEEPHRQVLAPAALGMDRCLERSRQSRPAADAAAAVPQRAGVAARGARGQPRQSQGGGPGDVLRRPGRRHARSGEDVARGGAGVHGRVRCRCGRHGAADAE